MYTIKLATPEEIEAVKEIADLQFAAGVYTFGDARAVYRLAPELDPVIYGDLSNSSKRAFLMLLEGHLRLSGVPAYYFHVSAGPEMEQYRNVVENFGAVRVNPEPEIHYKKVLT